ncbi:FAD-dependent oxidoreductase [Myceligenerans crystallogenes]|uniref:FAD dependent oxidoreductase domain-containing protein n=1 Tax=Myceligenerans crystallogenes TaxID=316335 RepID=A0ABN2NHH7_9MICO
MGHGRAPGVVVVGAGIIGLAAAWRALDAGATVTVLDPAPGAGATHAAAGMLGPTMEADFGERDLARFGARSVRLWPEFAAVLERAAGLPPGALGLDASGTLAVAFDADDAALLRRRLALHRDLGLGSREIPVAEARDREPSLGPRIAAAAWIPGDHQVDPRAVHRALLRVVTAHPDATLVTRAVASLRRTAVPGVIPDPGAASTPRGGASGPGVLLSEGSAPDREALPRERIPFLAMDGTASRPEALSRERVAGVVDEDGDGVEHPVGPARASEAPPRERVAGVVDEDGVEHPADVVVLAAGYASAGLYGGAATRAVPGTTLRLEADAAAGPSVVVRGTVQGRSVYVVPRAARGDGRREIVVGASSDERDATTRTRAGDVFALLRDARALLPGLDEADLIETTTRSRPATPDNLPLIGMAEPGLFLATGHHRNGILLTPHTAAVVGRHLARLFENPAPHEGAFA